MQYILQDALLKLLQIYFKNLCSQILNLWLQDCLHSCPTSFIYSRTFMCISLSELISECGQRWGDKILLSL